MSKGTFTPEKVRELCEFVFEDSPFKPNGWVENRITEWLEQNTIEPVVVGLSDEQFLNYWAWRDDDEEGEKCLRYFKEWQSTQTFSQTAEVKEVVVGLSDEQIEDLASTLDSWNIGDTDGFIFHIKKWCSETDFAQPNWGDSSAKYFQIRECWVDERGTVTSWKLNKQFERPKPTPQVEVGQAWKCAKTEVIVIALNEDDVVFQRVITKGFDVYSIIDFLAKFECVGGVE